MNWYLDVFKKYAVFSGRARRKEYWYFYLFSTIIGFALAAVDFAVGSFSWELGVGLFGGIHVLAVFLPGLAVSVRRLHDTGRSGWWMFITLIPIFGGIVLLVFMAQNSKPGQNQYGANPKEAIA